MHGNEVEINRIHVKKVVRVGTILLCWVVYFCGIFYSFIGVSSYFFPLYFSPRFMGRFARLLCYMKRRDPAAMGHRQQYYNVEFTKQAHSTWMALIIVAGMITYDQIMDPALVKPSIMDGRSNVI